MSNFPFPWWDKTVTIYNKVVDPTTQRITWYSTVVENCFWKYVNNLYNMGRYGMSTVGVQLEIKNVVCRIPKEGAGTRGAERRGDGRQGLHIRHAEG